MITAAQLRLTLPFARQRIPEFIDAINIAMSEFHVDKTVRREASFVAHVGHQSGQLRYVRETVSGHDYENRRDLGNTQVGDGERFKARGLLPIRGRQNYFDCGHALSLDLINHPELLEDPLHACRSAAWFWHTRKLNELADAGDQRQICFRIDPKMTGLQDSIALYARAMEVLAG